jgi:hypothetical protein
MVPVALQVLSDLTPNNDGLLLLLLEHMGIQRKSVQVENGAMCGVT